MRYGIRSKIMTLPIVVLIGTFIIVFLYINTLGHHRNKIDQLETNDINRSVQISNLFAALSSAQNDLEVTLRSQNVALTNEKNINKIDSLNEMIAQIMRDLDDIKATAEPTKVELRIFDVMYKKLDEYRLHTLKIKNDIASGNTTDLADDMLDIGHTYTQISIALNLIVQRMQGRTIETITDIIESEKQRSIIKLGVIGAMILVMIAVAIVMANFIARPIIELTALTSSIVKTRNFSLRTHIHSRGEVGELASSFNEMLDEIENFQAEQKNALEREHRFTENAAHELRTPLAALKIQAEVTMRMQDPDKRQEMLQKLLTNVDRTTHMVTQLLEFARLENDSMPMEDIDLEEVTDDIVEELSTMANHKHIELGFAADPNINFEISGNQRAIEILLRNLIGNAIKYTPRGGEIEVALKLLRDSIALEITDTGIGIPPADLNQICERFYRASDERANLEEGAGLGLAICKFIADAHEAKIDIENRRDRQGTRVNVAWPFGNAKMCEKA